MLETKAIDKLFDIMEIVEEAGGDCHKCPFYDIINSYSCPFADCAELWELRSKMKGV